MKKCVIFLMILLLMLSFSACIKKEAQNTPMPENTTAGPTAAPTATPRPQREIPSQMIDMPALIDSDDPVAQCKAYMTQLRDIVPYLEYLPDLDPYPNDSRIKAVYFQGSDFRNKQTKVFAYLGLPENMDENTPGVILVHGGGGHAFNYWVKLWVDKGYAAIAFDTEGTTPNGVPDINDQYGNTVKWNKTKNFAGPSNDNFSSSNRDLNSQWMFHSVSSSILAKNLLEALGVDPNKIGITGISWGGIIIDATVKYYSDYAFIAPLYNSFFQSESLYSGHIQRYQNPKTITLWDALEDDVKTIAAPVLMVNSDQDNTTLNTQNKALKFLEDGYLSIYPGLMHGHIFNIPDIFNFADKCVGKADSFVTNVSRTKEGNKLTETLNVPEGCTLKSATLYYLETPYTTAWTATHKGVNDNHVPWIKLPATINGNTITVDIPQTADSYYLSVQYTTSNGTCYYTGDMVIN